jgi:hypothetical protein
MADTEHRVEALEQEVEILKNQIQATLLSIQEHLLTHAHPELRPESAPPPEQLPTGGQPYPRVQTISANPQMDLPAPQSMTAVSQSVAAAPQPTAVDWKTMAELEEWTSNRIDRMGVEQTRALINAYAQKGRFSPEIANALLEFVTVYQNSMAPTIPHRPADFNPAPRPKAAQPAPQPPVVKAVAQAPKQPASSVKRPTQPTPASESAAAPKPATGKAAPSKTQAQNRNAQPKATAQPKPAAQPKAAMPKATKPANPPKEAEEEGGEHANLVLRLIAGVSNAGAGVKWKKSHG